ncbi:hypothetical protein [Thiomicrospira cyclica]|uniref:Uncharacterized protein n=1 Tax=Thiomicrospira cyclica (strain DSM 14477 / JCM 11371 / ALM1) TaxID=717773 RepID=F6DCU8_THICA|nr:hypothetical protein [Thiomicrospira cyclica]AEG31684.1 hypothetical protein Thicy_0914 [Thiomicrospira cyclica ALM1]
MYAIEFETDIKSKYIEIKDYNKVLNKHAKVIVLMEDLDSGDFFASQDDFIASLLNKPRHLEQGTVFLSRDEANE